MGYQLDDIWLEKFSNTKFSLIEKRRLYRIIMVLAIGVFYSVDYIFLYLFQKAGTIDITVFYLFCTMTILHVIIFSLLHWYGVSERFKNPHMTIWQMFFGVSIQLICISLAPQIMSYFLALIFIIFSFAIIRITFFESILAWFVTSVLIAIDLALSNPDKFGITHLSSDEKIIILFSFSSVLLRVILLGYYSTLIKEKLFRMNIELEKETKYDSLTKIYNRKTILDYYTQFINLCRRGKSPFCIVMIDIDHFKKVNDNFGHPVGDTILYEISKFIHENIRNIDKVGRYGGEEFLLLLQSNSLEEGMILVERIRMNLSNKKWDVLNNKSISISCGLHFVNSKNVDELSIKKADLALYEAKKNGRNRLVCFEDI